MCIVCPHFRGVNETAMAGFHGGGDDGIYVVPANESLKGLGIEAFAREP